VSADDPLIDSRCDACVAPAYMRVTYLDGDILTLCRTHGRNAVALGLLDPTPESADG
jgi:hypothetical protein